LKPFDCKINKQLRNKPMINEALKSAYRFHRAINKRASHKGRATLHHAWHALEKARDDVASGKTRYAESPWKKPFAAVMWQTGKPGIVYVDKPENAGLRFVGRVIPECGARNGFWDNSRTFTGWLTDPYGDSFKDGSGLCYGVVYQLPGRNGKARYVAGYQFGGTDGGPLLDLSDIHECDDGCTNTQYNGGAGDAARIADRMAQLEAEKERDYQCAWQAGVKFADCLTEIAENRKSVLQTIREIKGSCALVRQLPETLQAAIRATVQGALQERARLFSRLRALAAGEVAPLHFYPHNSQMQAAFCDGAGLSKFPE
jgi:hypothetical protein